MLKNGWRRRLSPQPDTAINQLFGGSGKDWFWLSDTTKSADVLNGYTAGEVVTFE
jgi:hypothetical protein